jgi:hypothetical protein
VIDFIGQKLPEGQFLTPEERARAGQELVKGNSQRNPRKSPKNTPHQEERAA